MNERDVRELVGYLNTFNEFAELRTAMATATKNMLEAYVAAGFTREEAMRLLEASPLKISKN